MSDSSPGPNSPPTPQQSTQPRFGAFFRAFNVTSRHRSSTLTSPDRQQLSSAAPVTDHLSDRLSGILASERSRRNAPPARTAPSASSPLARTQEIDQNNVYDLGPYDATPYEVFLANVIDARTSKQKAQALSRLSSAMRTYVADPIQAWIDVGHLASSSETADVRLAALDLLCQCISLAPSDEHDSSTSAYRANFYANFYADLYHFEDPDVSHVQKLTQALCALTRGGRDISGYSNVVELLCDWAKIAFIYYQTQRDEASRHDVSVSPLLDPSFVCPFVRLKPPSPPIYHSHAAPQSPSDHLSSPISLLINVHKYSFPQISPESLNLAAYRVLQICLSSSSEEDVETGLAYVDAVFCYGYIPTQYLPDVVDFVARTVALAGRVRVMDFSTSINSTGTAAAAASEDPLLCNWLDLPLTLPEKAQSLMNSLLRSPTNQILRHLRQVLAGPIPDEAFSSTHPQKPQICDNPVLVGSLTCFRSALRENSLANKNSSLSNHSPTNPTSSISSPPPSASSTSASRPINSSPLIPASQQQQQQPPKLNLHQTYPSSLNIGLALVYENLCALTGWKSLAVDAEILALVFERLEVEISRGSKGGHSGESENSQISPESGTKHHGHSRTRSRDSIERSNSLEVGRTSLKVHRHNYDLWDMAIEILERLFWHVETWEKQTGKMWIFDFDTAKRDESGQDDNESIRSRDSSVASLRQVLDYYTKTLGKLVKADHAGEYDGPPVKFERFMSQIFAHLSDEACCESLHRIEANNLVLPSYPSWIDRLMMIASIYAPELASSRQNSSSRFPSSFQSSRVYSRRKALSIIKNTYGLVRAVDIFRADFSTNVILPLLSVAFKRETDALMRQDLDWIIKNFAFDCLAEPLDDNNNANDDDPYAEGNDPFDILYSIIVDALENVPSNPSHKPNQYTPEHEYIAVQAVYTLISIFHTGLEISSARSSTKIADIYLGLTNMLAPPLSATPESLPDTITESEPVHTITSILPKRARILALSWFVRFRADEDYRIRIVKDAEIVNDLTVILRRVFEARGLENAKREQRELKQQQQQQQQSGYNSRLGKRLAPYNSTSSTPSATTPSDQLDKEREDPLAAFVKGNSSAQAGTSTKSNNTNEQSSPSTSSSPINKRYNDIFLTADWIDIAPFSEPNVLKAYGTRGLRSFDQEQNPNYVEVSEQENLEAQKLMGILPVSEWFRAAHIILKYDTDVELVSYLLCYLPAQLSNKAYSCGRFVAREIRLICKLFCEKLANDEWPAHVGGSMASRRIRHEIQLAGYYTLTSLIAYRNLFSKDNHNAIVDTFISGLGGLSIAAKPCINALYLAAYDLRTSLSRSLPGVLNTLTRIMMRSDMAVHILELIATIGKSPSLSANFTDNNFRAVFGIALQYITIHTQQSLQSEPSSSASPNSADSSDIQYAFSQYVYHLAFSVLNIWFMGLKVSDRKKYVPFITRKLVKANEGRKGLDEPVEVCLDMMARCVYSNAAARPNRAPSFAETALSNISDPSSLSLREKHAYSKTWIVGNSLVTVQKLKKAGWAEIVVRRPSGYSKAFVELMNSVPSSLETDDSGIASLLCRREESDSANDTQSLIREAHKLIVLGNRGPSISNDRQLEGDTLSQPQVISTQDKNVKSRSESDLLNSDNEMMKPTDRRDPLQKEEIGLNRHSDGSVLNIGATTRASGGNASSVSRGGDDVESQLLEALQQSNIANELVVEPSYYALQITPLASSLSTDNLSNTITLVPDEERFLRTVNVMDSIPLTDHHRIGVLYAGPLQTDETSILANTNGSSNYLSFLSGLGRLVRLKGFTDFYLGGLDIEHDTDGKWGIVHEAEESKISFHVATLMPTDLERDARCMRKKAHIGNDFVRIIFNESGLPYSHDTIASQYNFVNIVIEPHYMVKGGMEAEAFELPTTMLTPSGVAIGGSSYYKVTMLRQADMPDFGPLGAYKTVSAEYLPHFVRQVSLHADIFANVYLECVGVNATADKSNKQKVEFVGNWRHRLQTIKRLKSQIEASALAAQATSPTQLAASDLTGNALNNLSNSTGSTTSSNNMGTGANTNIIASTSTGMQSATASSHAESVGASNLSSTVSAVGQTISNAMNLTLNTHPKNNPAEIADAAQHLRSSSNIVSPSLDVEATILKHDFTLWTA